MKIDEIRALLERYQQGLCTEEEKKAIEEWQGSLWLGQEEPLNEQEVQNSLSRIRLRLQPLAGNEVARPPAAAPIYRIRRWTKVTAAAAAIVLVILGTWLFFTPQKQNVERIAHLDPNSDTTVITSRGETRQIVLADGSTIQLNAATELRYPKRFAGRERSVTLVKGEVFFQVAAHPEMPFIVTAGNTRTTVLGTSFNIRNYGQEKDIQISVMTGKVAVATTRVQTAGTLSPKEFLRIDKTTGVPASGKFDQEYEVAAWKDGGLQFKDASFKEIAFQLGNKYNIDIVNKSNKQQWSYTGLFRNGSLEDAIQTICQTEGLSYRFTAAGILITDMY